MSYSASRKDGGGRPILASFCAGPIYVATLMFAEPLTNPGVNVTGVGALAVILPFAVVFGFVLAIGPTLIGTVAMRWVGAANEATRLPIFWALVGGLVAGGGALAFDASTAVIVGFATTGTCCAAICRARVRWG